LAILILGILIPIMMMPITNKLVLYNLCFIDLLSRSHYTENSQKTINLKKLLNDDFSSFKQAGILLIPVFLNNFFIMFNLVK
jgi:hypothetical protein